MQELARGTGQSNHLCVHHDTRLVVLARAESPEPMSYSVRQGSHFPFHDDRVSARVISAFQQGARREQFLAELAGTGRDRAARRRSLTNASKKSASAATTRVRATPSAASWISAFPFSTTRRSGLAQHRLHAPSRYQAVRAGCARETAPQHAADLETARMGGAEKQRLSAGCWVLVLSAEC